MDGKVVDQAVRDTIRPALRDAGFDRFTARSAWRRHDQTADFVVVRSFTSYAASVVGCTTYSFAITAGVYYQCMSEQDIPRPKEYELTFRFELGKSLRQPWFQPDGNEIGHDRPDVWYVRLDGSNVDDCVVEGLAAIRAQGLPLVDRFTEPHGAYHALLTETSTSASFGAAGVTMPGNPDSPSWRNATLAIGHLVTPNPRPDMWHAPVLAGGDRAGAAE